MIKNIILLFFLGFNEETFGRYCKSLRSKLASLQKAVKENRIFLPSSNLSKYLFDFFPSDYGGLNDVLDEQKFENLNFFEYKRSKIRNVPSLEVKQGLVCVPLENRNENLNINYNATTNVNIESLNNNISLERTEAGDQVHQTNSQFKAVSSNAATSKLNLLNPPQIFVPPNLNLNIPYYIPYYRPPFPHFILPRNPMMVMPGDQSVGHHKTHTGERESRSKSRDRNRSEESRKKHKSKIFFDYDLI